MLQFIVVLCGSVNGFLLNVQPSLPLPLPVPLALSRQVSIIDMPPGMGKTLIIATLARRLIDRGGMPDFMLVAVPKDALASALVEYTQAGLTVEWLLPLKTRPRWATDEVKIPPGAKMRHAPQDARLHPYVVTVLLLDHMRYCAEGLLEAAPRCFVSLDEMHLVVPEDTQRSTLARDLASSARLCVGMTGTLWGDPKQSRKLTWWLQAATPWHVTQENFFTAALGGRIARRDTLGIEVLYEAVESKAWPSADTQAAFGRLVHAGGGRGRAAEGRFLQALALCNDAVLPAMVGSFHAARARGERGAMLVADTMAHAERLRDALVASGVPGEDVLLLTGAIHLTAESVAQGTHRAYRAVIVPKARVHGYSLTLYQTLITGVYCGFRDVQAEGRIRRLGQTSPVVRVVRHFIGPIQAAMLQRKIASLTVAQILRVLAKDGAFVE